MMNLGYSFKISLICAAALMMVGAVAQAGAEQEVVASMQSRLPAVMQLKLSGKVGEANTALLVVRGELQRDERRLMADENRDRLAFYKQIAQRVGAPLARVQAGRAQDIREKSPKGVWLQSAKGDWYQK